MTYLKNAAIIKLNKYKTVLIGSSNIAAERTETCWQLRSRMETRYEVAQEQLSESGMPRVDTAGRQPLSCQALHGISGDAYKVAI